MVFVKAIVASLKMLFCFVPVFVIFFRPDLIHSRMFQFWLGSTMPFFLFVDPLDQRTRVMSCTQFVSQVLPSSGESACSQWPDVGVMLDQRKRARTRFPFTVSSP